MGYENSTFPLTSGTSFNRYGVVETQAGLVSGGELHGSGGSVGEAVIYVDHTDFTVSGGIGRFSSRYILPVGTIPREAWFEVTEAFTQTGGTTSTTLSVGTAASAETNGFSISDAATSIAVVTGELDTSAAGTWNSPPLTGNEASRTIGCALTVGGGTMTAVTAGKAKIIVRYTKA